MSNAVLAEFIKTQSNLTYLLATFTSLSLHPHVFSFRIKTYQTLLYGHVHKTQLYLIVYVSVNATYYFTNKSSIHIIINEYFAKKENNRNSLEAPPPSSWLSL